jgi:hypothetical protein
MNPFNSSNLSPLPNEPVEAALPYDLTWDDLRPALPGFDPPRQGQALAFTSHAKQGLNGGDNSCILTLRYPVNRRWFLSETIFFKRSRDPKKTEAQKYRFISGQGVPTPRLLAAFQKGESEVILLEFLPTIGINFKSPSEVDSLLRLVAKLNTIRNPPDWSTPSPGLPQVEFDQLVQAALAEMASDWSLPEIVVSRWFEAYQDSQQAALIMPLAVNHNEFYFQQVGWAQRRSSRRLVLFDLESMALAPRFTDIANILYPLSVYTGRDQDGLFKIYLDRYFRLSKVNHLSFSDALRELRFTRIKGLMESLPWLVNQARQTSFIITPEGLSRVAECLWDDLRNLGLLG